MVSRRAIDVRLPARGLPQRRSARGPRCRGVPAGVCGDGVADGDLPQRGGALGQGRRGCRGRGVRRSVGPSSRPRVVARVVAEQAGEDPGDERGEAFGECRWWWRGRWPGRSAAGAEPGDLAGAGGSGEDLDGGLFGAVQVRWRRRAVPAGGRCRGRWRSGTSPGGRGRARRRPPAAVLTGRWGEGVGGGGDGGGGAGPGGAGGGRDRVRRGRCRGPRAGSAVGVRSTGTPGRHAAAPYRRRRQRAGVSRPCRFAQNAAAPCGSTCAGGVIRTCWAWRVSR